MCLSVVCFLDNPSNSEKMSLSTFRNNVEDTKEKILIEFFCQKVMMYQRLCIEVKIKEEFLLLYVLIIFLQRSSNSNLYWVSK